MSASASPEARNLKAKKLLGQPPSLANPGHSGPTTFFLRSERDLNMNMQPRGRKESRTSMDKSEGDVSYAQRTPSASMMGDSSFGVQSLEDAINAGIQTEDTMRSTSQASEREGRARSSEFGVEGGLFAGQKRKARNPVHPKILATGQRIISSEHSTQASSSASPVSLRSSESPFRTHLRRGSASSSANFSQPLTPLRLSPQPESTMPGTPRSTSVKSFRLSDEEASSVASETGSQAIQSSSGEDDDDEPRVPTEYSTGTDRAPELVMPSIAMPARRPFTQRGRNMGRLKVMVVGPCGVGKTSLIRSIVRTCEDIVHVDPLSSTSPSQSTTTSKSNGSEATKQITETHASTKPYPLWWSDLESSRTLWRRKSFGEGILERNICFVDTPGIDSEDMAHHIMKDITQSYRQNAQLEMMSENQMLSLFGGDGGNYVDVVLYLFDLSQDVVSDSEWSFLKTLSSLTNFVPLIARSDTVSELAERRQEICNMLEEHSVECYSLADSGTETGRHGQQAQMSRLEPFAISSLADDSDIMDASLLMASDYLPQLAPSDLTDFVDRLLSPSNIARLRHLSAKKFLLWRKEHLRGNMDLEKQKLLQPSTFGNRTGRSPFASDSAVTTDTGSLLGDPSKVLVPHASSSYYRSLSPSISDYSATGAGASAETHTHGGSDPIRQIHVAKWARDLQRSLANESTRYGRMFTHPATSDADAVAEMEDGTSDNEKNFGQALIPHDQQTKRAERGRLGGDLAVIDPRDPLGVLGFSQAFRRRGWFALQVAGSFGFVGVVAWWVVRNWGEVQEWFGFGGGNGVGGYAWYEKQPHAAIAIPAPQRGVFDEVDWKAWVGMRDW